MTPRPPHRRVAPLAVAGGVAATVLATAAPMPAPTQIPDDYARRWEGTVTHRMVRTSTNEAGSVTSSFRMNVRWRERQRIDVLDDAGRTTGQIIVLEDDGSSWTGTLDGAMVREDACSVSQSTYSGSGSGSDTITTGWVYFSLDDEDPLAGRVPNGTYFVAGNPQQRFQGTMVVDYEKHCSPPMAYTNSADYPGGVIGMRLGHAPISWPNEIPGGQLPASAVIDAYERADAMGFNDMQVAGGDSMTRQLVDGAMIGDYVNDPGTGLRWESEWDVHRRLDVTVLLEEVDRDWWPTGGAIANTTTVHARIEDDRLEGRFIFTLAGVTDEPGYAMNAGTESGKDLEFAEGQSGFDPAEETDDGWRIEGNEAVSEADIVIQSRDYGAWGQLSCEVIIDGESYDCETAAGGAFASVPVDEDDDLIADSWSEDNAAGSDDTDTEPSGTAEDGDGLSTYEEYRGFVTQGIHYRTDPTRKTVFLRDDQGLARSTTALTIFDLYYVSASELGGDNGRMANFNQCQGEHAGHHVTDQHGVHVINGGASASWDWGCAFPCVERVIGPPITCDNATVYVPQIAADLNRYREGRFRDLTSLITNQTTDHEVGHCLSARHHNDAAPDQAPTEDDGPVCTMRYLYTKIWKGELTTADVGQQFCSAITLPTIDVSDPS